MSDLATELAKVNPSAQLLEPREHFDQALVAITDTPEDHWSRQQGALPVAVYDTGKCVIAIMAWLECDEEGAWEWFSFNTAEAWVGEGTPTFCSDATA